LDRCQVRETKKQNVSPLKCRRCNIIVGNKGNIFEDEAEEWLFEEELENDCVLENGEIIG